MSPSEKTHNKCTRLKLHSEEVKDRFEPYASVNVFALPTQNYEKLTTVFFSTENFYIILYWGGGGGGLITKAVCI